MKPKSFIKIVPWKFVSDLKKEAKKVGYKIEILDGPRFFKVIDPENNAEVFSSIPINAKMSSVRFNEAYWVNPNSPAS